MIGLYTYISKMCVKENWMNEFWEGRINSFVYNKHTCIRNHINVKENVKQNAIYSLCVSLMPQITFCSCV